MRPCEIEPGDSSDSDSSSSEASLEGAAREVQCAKVAAALLAILALAALAPRLAWPATGLEALGLSVRSLFESSAVAMPCSLTVAGTCRFTGQCDKSHGNTSCRSGRCVCSPGHCATSAGLCLPQAQALSQPSASRAVRVALGLHRVSSDLMCQDTPGWTDGWLHCGYEDGGNRSELCPPTPGASWPSTSGWTCQAYREKGWCSNGVGEAAQLGLLWRNPERHCCACGGGRRIASRPASAESLAVAGPEERCERDTGGSCAWTKSCGRFRGPVSCESGRCMCQEGYCSDVAGTCHPRAPLAAAPLASRVVREALGLHSLVGGLCEDSEGWTDGWSLCAYEPGGRRSELCRPTPGAAWPSVAGWTCRAYEEKGWCAGGRLLGGHLGALFPEQHCCACGGGRTLARAKPESRIKVNATCSRDTRGTCRLLGECRGFRGEAMCEESRCLCSEGYCTDSAGACYRDMGMVTASVVPVQQSQPAFPGAQGNARTGLCFSGGGARAASAALGVLRALHSLGLLQGLDALSAVSGGSWAASVYMFANVSLMELLGRPTEPSRLTLSALSAQPASLGAVALAATSATALALKAGGVPLEALWVATVAEAILKPFGLGSLRAPMARDAEAVAEIRARNPQLREQAFAVPQPGRPRTFVIGGTVEAPDGYRASEDNAVSLQMSPDFTGSPFYPNNRTVSYNSSLGPGRRPPLRNVLLGGGLVETFAFGGEEPVSQQSGGNGARLRAPVQPLSLARAVAISSAAFAGAASQAGLTDSSAGAKVSPHGNLWPVTSAQHPGPRQAVAFQLGDGGNIDDTGLMVLLQRRVPKIVMVLSTDAPLESNANFCAAGADMDVTGKVSAALADKFGIPALSNMKGLFWSRNQVFAKAALPPLLCRLGKLRWAGEPLVARERLEVQPNSWWGIPGGNTVDLLLVLLDKSEGFESLLPEETRAEVARGRLGRFASFPHYKTVFQTADLTALTAEQVNLLAAQLEYSVLKNSQDFEDLFRQ